jgi:hypothetical protein
MISWRARTHQQCDSVPLLTYRTKQGKSGTRRSPALVEGKGQQAAVLLMMWDQEA